MDPAVISSSSDLRERLLRLLESPLLAAVVLVALLTLVYHRALHFAPTDGDQLILLSSVAHTDNPLIYFAGDWGLGNAAYRPIHSLLLWASYRLFRVWALPDQALNLLLHVINVLLLYGLMRRSGSGPLPAFLAAGMAGISRYTFPSVAWISDRPMLLAALFTLIALHLLLRPGGLSWPQVALFSALALTSKESGLLLPLTIVVVLSAQTGRSIRQRFGGILAAAAVMLAYLVLRLILFGSLAGYTESGFLFLTRGYHNLSDLPPSLRAVAIVENVVKSIMAIFLPVFNGAGGLVISEWTAGDVALVLLTAAVSLRTLRAWRRPSTPQRVALLIILLNALIHFAIFRYRTLYLAQFAFAWWIASAPEFLPGRTKRPSPLTILSLAGLLAVSVALISLEVSATFNLRIALIDELDTALRTTPSIDPEIVEQVRALYSPSANP